MVSRMILAIIIVLHLGVQQCGGSSNISKQEVQPVATSATPRTTDSVAGIVVISTLCFESPPEIRDLVGNFLTFTEPSTQLVLHINAASVEYNGALIKKNADFEWVTNRTNVHINPKRIHVRWGTYSIVHAHLINAQYAFKYIHGIGATPEVVSRSIFVMQASNMFWVRPGMEVHVRKARCIAPFADIMGRTSGHDVQGESVGRKGRPRRGDGPPKWAIMTRAPWLEHLHRSRGWSLQRATQERAEPMMAWATQNSTVFSAGHEGFYAGLADIEHMATELDKLKLPSPRTFAPEEHLVASWLGTRTNSNTCTGKTLLCFKAVKGDVLTLDQIRSVASGRMGGEMFAVKRVPRLSEIDHGQFGGKEEDNGSGAPRVRVKNKRALATARLFVQNMTDPAIRRPGSNVTTASSTKF
jgi:hypothetical protein